MVARPVKQKGQHKTRAEGTPTCHQAPAWDTILHQEGGNDFWATADLLSSHSGACHSELASVMLRSYGGP